MAAQLKLIQGEGKASARLGQRMVQLRRRQIKLLNEVPPLDTPTTIVVPETIKFTEAELKQAILDRMPPIQLFFLSSNFMDSIELLKTKRGYEVKGESDEDM